MSERGEVLLSRLRQNLHYVALDAERLRPTELALRSSEMWSVAHDLDEIITQPRTYGILKLRVGRTAVEGVSFRKLPYDFVDATHHVVEPGEEHELRFRQRVFTDTLGSRVTEPVYGWLRYFDLATIGRTLDDDGELSFIGPESSSSE